MLHDFVHLRLHSEYSVTDSIIRIKQAAELANQDKMCALALTDLHNIFALVKFYTACRAYGIKPIIGAELNVTSGMDDATAYKIILLAKNTAGYRELCELITRSYSSNKIFDIPYINEDWLLNATWPNLIMLSGGQYGDVGSMLLNGKTVAAQEKAMRWAKAFPDNYYIELHRFNYSRVNELIRESVNLAHTLNLPVVATQPIYFAHNSDFEAHEVRVCVAESNQLDDSQRKSKFDASQYFTTQREMCERFADIPSSINNTLEIAKRCNVEIPLGKYFLPDFTAPGGMQLNEYLVVSSNQGLDKRLSDMPAVTGIEVYRERLEREIETIIQMGFTGYFLIVADFINWARHKHIPVGPGRGSGAGSLVAFALGITDIDPLRYDLLFERFLNPERVSLPDFDIDFCPDKREQVIDYVKDKYGLESVAQIATFGTMSSKAVIKDVGRVLGLPYGLCDSISKLILNTPVKSYSLQEAYSTFTEIKEKIDNADDEVLRLWELSKALEDIVRSVGKHAAGVLIAPGKITDFCPLYLADDMPTSQLDKDDVDAIGLVKFDFLGLRNLTILEDTIANIRQLHNVNVNLSNYDFSDIATYQLLQTGNTAAIFQLESPGMRRVLIKLAPDRFEDIIALLALYRPGPLGSGMVDDFIKRKKGEQLVDYFHTDLTACLAPTYGVIVYQEQVMQIAQIIGGYTLGSADLLRRAMGKKKPSEMAKHKSVFIQGAIDKGYPQALAENLFDLMAKFAEYGFNKSHSTAYAVISYHTAYLKTHYLSCFMAATLSSELDKTDKLYEFYQDCLNNNLTILPPSINHSVYRFLPLDNTTIRYALGAIKGVGESAAQLIVDERNTNGIFTSVTDFCRRTYKKNISKRTIEHLVKAGAFDVFDSNRAKLFNNINKVLEHIDNEVENANQGSLFDFAATHSSDANTQILDDIALDNYPVWTLKETLAHEKQALGYYFSGSLFDEYQEIVKRLAIPSLTKFVIDNEEMQEIIHPKSRNRQKVLVCGVISTIGSRALKKGGRIFFINIEDDAGSIEFILYEEDYQRYKTLIKEDEMIFVSGELTYDSFRNQIKINAKDILQLDAVLAMQIRSITITIDASFDLNDLAPMLGNHGAHLIVYYSNSHGQCQLNMPEHYQFVPSYANISKLGRLLDKSAWHIN